MDDRDIRNLAAARRLYEGEDGEGSVIAPDIVWHVPGHNPVSGAYRGRSAYLEEMPATMAPLTRWDFTLESVMPNGDFVMTTFHVVGERKGVLVDLHGGHLLRMNDRGQVEEGWGFTDDQDALDRSFSA